MLAKRLIAVAQFGGLRSSRLFIIGALLPPVTCLFKNEVILFVSINRIAHLKNGLIDLLIKFKTLYICKF